MVYTPTDLELILTSTTADEKPDALELRTLSNLPSTGYGINVTYDVDADANLIQIVYQGVTAPEAGGTMLAPATKTVPFTLADGPTEIVTDSGFAFRRNTTYRVELLDAQDSMKLTAYELTVTDDELFLEPGVTLF